MNHEVRFSSAGQISEIEDVETLLDMRAEALRVAGEIGRQIQGDATLPETANGWRSRAVMAQRHAFRAARLVSARILEIDPDALAGEKQEPIEPAAREEIAALKQKVAHLTKRFQDHNRLAKHRSEQIRSGKKKLAKQQTHIEGLQGALAATKENNRTANHLAAQAAETERQKDYGRRFMKAAKMALTGEQYRAICDAANAFEAAG